MGRKKEGEELIPTGVIRCQPAGSQHTMDMRVKQQALIPTVQYAEKADLRSEMARIAGDLQQCLRAGVEQQVEDQLLVLQDEGRQFPWQSENCMYVSCGQKLSFPRMQPAQAGVALARRAMPVAARVV